MCTIVHIEIDMLYVCVINAMHMYIYIYIYIIWIYMGFPKIGLPPIQVIRLVLKPVTGDPPMT